MTALVIFELIDVHFWNRIKRVFGLGRVKDDVIIVNLLRVIFYGKCYFHVLLYPSWLQMTKFCFGICHFKAQIILGRFSL